jgi:plasmid maintenance system antidote protein VapI
MIEIKIVPRIRERLAEMGRRPHWLSEQTSIDPSSLTRIMNGKGVTLDTAFAISAALGRTIEQLWIIKEVESEDRSADSDLAAGR